MTNLTSLISSIPDFAKDTKINLENLLSEENNVLTYKQILGTALACAYAANSEEKMSISSLRNEAKTVMDESEIKAIRSAASIMAMNNIYYRFAHLANDDEYLKMPAGLRMKIIQDHGIDKIDFEIYCLAISIINGCGLCIESHTKALIKAGLSKTQIQMIAKIAAVVNSACRSITIDEVI